tara:strand:+ start:310 stop:609 length:300 start_codon:yes stop_codon:yes gene_type:complete
MKKSKEKIFNNYARDIAEIFSIDVEDLFVKNKTRDIVDARQLLYYVCKKRPMPVVYIQEFMKKNGYDTPHTSILYGIKMATKKSKSDQDYKTAMKNLQV